MSDHDGSNSSNGSDALREAIAALEAQRARLGDAVIDTAVAPLRRQLAALSAPAPSPAPTPAALHMRQVTVLFAAQCTPDAAGGASTLDAEDAAEADALLLRRLQTVINAHGGRVMRFMGDGLKAVFGVDGARDDDAERAVQAALQLHEAAREHAQWLRQHFAPKPQLDCALRVGLHSGPVMLGAGVEAQNTASGFNVHLAARMHQVAPAGSVCISRATADLLRGAFVLDAQPPRVMKGVTEPQLTFLVRHALPSGPQRGIDGVSTALVGREPELQALREAWQGVVQARRGHALAVIAEAGLGKSRLQAEFQAELRRKHPGALLLHAAAHPSSRLAPYGLLRELLLRWAAQQDGVRNLAQHVDPPSQAKRLQQALQAELRDATAAGRIAALVGVAAPSAGDAADAAFAALRDWLARLAARQPLLLVIDDAHWADDGTLALLRACADDPALPLLLLLLARPELDERAAWQQRPLPRIELAPLDDAARHALAAQMLARLSAPVSTAASPSPSAAPSSIASLQALLTGRGGGNPLHMEELLRALIDDGSIDTHGEHWHADPAQLQARLHSDCVPGTLIGLLQARLDALPPAERKAVQAAAVTGTVFWDDVLPTQQRSVLPALLRRQWVQLRTPGAFAGAVEYEFSHPLLQQACYDSTLKAARRAAHERSARWLAERLGDAARGAHLALAAQHFERAGLRADAASWYARAAHDAERRWSARDGLALIDHWLALLDDDALEQRFEAQTLRLQLLDNAGERAAQRAGLVELEALAERAGNLQWRASACIDRALLADRLSDFVEAANLAQRGAALAEAAADWDLATLGHGERAWALRRLGRPRAAVESAECALALARQHGPAHRLAQLLAVRAALAEQLGHPAEACARMREAVAVAHGSGSTKTLAILQCNLADALATAGQATAAHACLNAARPVLLEIDNRQTLAYAQSIEAALALIDDRPEAAADAWRQAASIARAIDDRYNAARSELHLARVLLQRGDVAAAIGLGQRAHADFEAGANADEALEAQALLAWAHARTGRRDQAAELLNTLEAALEAQRAAATESPPVPPPLGLLHRRWRAWNEFDPARAGAALAAARAAFNAQRADFTDPAERATFESAVPAHRELIQG